MIKKFIKQSNFILNNKKNNFIIKSISCLHFLKFHPEYLNFHKKINFFNVIYIIKLSLRIYNFISYNLLKFFFHKNTLIPKSSVLIISHCINKSDLLNKNHQDRYLGKLREILDKKNYSYFFILLNHTIHRSFYLNNINRNSNTVVIDDYLPIRLEIKVFFLKLYYFLYIIFDNKNFRDIKKKILLSLFDSQTAVSLKMFYAIKYFLLKTNSKFLILTYEGYSWERLSIFSAKSIDKNIKCIGYQHSLITKNNYSIFRSIPGGFNPDCVWTSTKWAFNNFRDYKNKNINVVNTGSLRALKKLKNNKNNKYNKNNILVIPEGIYSECYKLFDFTIKCALENKKLNFFWKLHPVISANKILDHYKSSLISLPKNIKILNNKNKIKIKSCYFALYRGSSAILEAVRFGFRPIYFNNNEHLNIDPIGLSRKNFVNTVEDFAYIIKTSYKLESNSANNYSKLKNKIYSDLNEKKLLKTLK